MERPALRSATGARVVGRRALLLTAGTALALLVARAIAPAPAAARPAVHGPDSRVSLTYVAGSTVKVEQIIGEQDYQTKAPTASRTVSRFNILANDLGSSFEDNGKLVFLFGDTVSGDPKVNFHAHDPIASSTSTDPNAGLVLDFFTNSDGSPLFVEPPGIGMGGDNVPNSGISLPDGVYIVINAGADENLSDPHQNAYSLLARFDENTKTFTAGRTISQLPGGHLVFDSVHASGADVLTFGTGRYRASDVYLSITPASGFESGVGTRYFAGFVKGQPTWSSSETSAVPVVQDNPLNGPAWPNDNPTIGNVSVIYSADLDLWLMTYDGGRQTQKTKGVYFSCAQQPWGPWSAPQLIFNAKRDNGLGTFIHDPTITPDPPGDGLNGPTAGTNDPYTTPGADYAPFLIERFTRVSRGRLTISYTLSTWNPYTVVRMRSEFAITRETPRLVPFR
jgi:uncharacterized protein DUF4185